MANAPLELAAIEERRKRTDKSSAAIGEKLLKGWTMYAFGFCGRFFFLVLILFLSLG